MSIYFVRGIVLNTTGNSKNMRSCTQEAHVLVASLTTAITCLYSHQPEPSLLPPISLPMLLGPGISCQNPRLRS